MQEQNRQRDHRIEVKTIATGVFLEFVRQSNGRMVANTDREDVLFDTAKMIQGIVPGQTVECDILLVRTGDVTRLTATPTEATRSALMSANKWPVGMVKLTLCFRMKDDGNGAYAIEPATGKRVYPDEGFRVWVNQEAEYLCDERGRIIIARPIVEPQRVERDEDNRSAPHTYREPSRDRREHGRPSQNRQEGRDGGGRQHRRGGKGRQHGDGGERGQRSQPPSQEAKPADEATPPKSKPADGRKTFTERHGTDATAKEPAKAPEVSYKKPHVQAAPRGTIADQLLEQGLVKK